MGQPPSTVFQLAVLVLFVLPGAVHQFLRERWRGPVPQERVLSERVLRALVASIVLDTAYAVAAGPELLRLVGVGGDGLTRAGLVGERIRWVGLWGLVLFVAVPAATAAAVSLLQRRHLRARYQSTPSAWDHVFRDRQPCFVRLRLKDGTWVGGWYGNESYATSYPQPHALHLESAWRMLGDGSFAERVEGTAGLHVSGTDVDIVEMVDAPTIAPGAPAEP
ncbi:DUF6338 family protein [Streptomyces tsukubensis]|uniref:Uncharacterized protein n=1 Tax=Streptomyces tsukubensis TaxID=83656 RepID=A0A1V4A9S5_9ACTN|nr:DUF6338 family protein [Streptomyces tsukubensis]OON79614.1 hypothetical protein B1H18_13625 [Streptomyces tsukubensis]QFR95798.1 hypothetical protein GBW32_25650 [Streptomyces tsukubensis]